MTGGLVRTTFYLFLLCLALLLGYTIWTADISKTARFFLLGLAIVLAVDRLAFVVFKRRHRR